MRRLEIVRTLLKFNELNDRQKSIVIDKNYNINVEHDWYEFLLDDFKRDLKKLGFSDIEINFSGFSSQGDGASFTGVLDLENIEKIKKKNLEFYWLDKTALGLFKATSFDDDETIIEINRTGSMYYHYNTVSSYNDSLNEFVQYVSKEIYKALESNYDCLTSNESITESLINNDYEFYSDTLEIY